MATAMTGLLGKLTKGEQLALAGAAVVLFVTFLLFDIILNATFGFSDLATTASVAMLAVIWLKAEGRYDIGANYRLIVALLGLSIAVPAAMSALHWLRLVVTPFGFGGGLALVAVLSFWIGGALAGAGAWWVWKGR